MPIRLEALTRWTIQLKLGFGPFIYGIFEIRWFCSTGRAFFNPNGLKIAFCIIFECRYSRTDKFELVLDFQFFSWYDTSFEILWIFENTYFDCKTLLWRLCLVSYDSKGFGQLPLWLVLFEETFGFDRIIGVKSERSFKMKFSRRMDFCWINNGLFQNRVDHFYHLIYQISCMLGCHGRT